MVYVLMMDEYGRADQLLEENKFDNSAFIGELRDLGFTVSDCSLANYTWTIQAVPAMLNFNYLTPIDGDPDPPVE